MTSIPPFRAAFMAALVLGAGQVSTPPVVPPAITTPPGSAAVEQTSPGAKPPAVLVASFDGLGVGFEGPQGSAAVRNPSDNSLAVGPDHIVQTVNSRMAIFTKKGQQFDDDGQGPLRPGRDQQRLQRVRRYLRDREQRRRRRAIRPARRSMVDRHANLPARSTEARSARAIGKPEGVSSSARPAGRGSPARPRDCIGRHHLRLRRRRNPTRKVSGLEVVNRASRHKAGAARKARKGRTPCATR